MTWKKGMPSPNPGGRPKEVADVRKLARSRTKKAVRVLSEIMESADTPANVRVLAAQALLDRGYGRPTQHSEQARFDTAAMDETTQLDVARRVAWMLELAARKREAKPKPTPLLTAPVERQ